MECDPETWEIKLKGEFGKFKEKFGGCKNTTDVQCILALPMTMICYFVQSDNKHDAATAYVDAANCYKKTSKKGVINSIASWIC